MAEDVVLRGHVVGGSYKLVRHLEDGVPSLYEAQHPCVAGRFAARLWPLTVPWDAFRRGAEIAATLRHPGAVQVVDFNCEPGAPPFVITEWPSGMRLSYLLGTSGPIPMPRVASLIESTAWTLAAAHQQGIVHQELRPADIFVIEGVGTTRAWTKLDGLGLAAALVRAEAAPASPYRAPEQATTPDEDGADPLSDQYALGAIAYEMLAGVRPSAAVAAGAEAQEPRRIFDIVPGVPAAVDAVVRRALAAEPEHRFDGIMDFARAFREATEGVNTQVVRRKKVEPRNAVRALPTEEVAPPPRLVPTPLLARLRPLASKVLAPATWSEAGAALAKLVPRGASARVAVAIAVLVIGVGAIATRRHAPARKPAAVALAKRPAEAKAPATPAAVPTPAPAPPAPAVTTLASVSPTEAAPPAAAAETPTAEVKVPPATEPEAETPAVPELTEPVHKRRPTTHRVPVVATTSVGGAAKPRPLPAAPAAAATAAPDAALGCVISIGSKPSADVWLDERKLNRRTPLVGYRVGCGDHKLALKREDLDLYQMEVITVRAGKPFKKAYPLQ